MNRLPVTPLITRGIAIAEKYLGMEALAERLRAHPDTIRAWRDGHATMPERKFLLLVDILTDLDPNWRHDSSS
jgi:hypothetical protein